MKREAPERAVQIAIINRLALYGVECWSIPNEARRSIVAGRMMKAAGLTPGAPDLICIGPEGRVAFLEVKAPKGVVSERQADVHERLRRKGHVVAVVRSQDDAYAVLEGAGWFA